MSASRNPHPSRSPAAWSHWSLLGPLPDGWPPPTGFCSSWGTLGTRPPGPAGWEGSGEASSAAPLIQGPSGWLCRQHQGRPAFFLLVGHHHRALQVL